MRYVGDCAITTDANSWATLEASPGFVSRVMLVPEENLGVIILTNAEQEGAFDSILYHILDHYFALPQTDWIAAFKDAAEEEPESGHARP